ncbi:MAG TPA: adenosylhomocysteinase, partial [Candidatus Nitrosopolaris rasttigaisensis]|nr:adenosylhomocysteinase [Candidatus Nitrosopolaris rasttigaisensis]
KMLGAEIAICSANPLSTQDDVAAFLYSEGIRIFAWRGQSERQYRECIKSVLQFRPDILTDDGGDLHIAAHKLRKTRFYGGTEETTTGVKRLGILQSRKRLRYPVIAVNNAYTKYLFDNRYGTGQSTIDGILRTTGLFLSGKQVIVCGYGWVGKGVSVRARGMGAIVTITEIDPIKALEAHMDGFNVKQLSEIAQFGDIFITCTGNSRVIREEHLIKMKDGAILANAGHFDVEIDIDYLTSQDKFPLSVRPNVDCFKFSDKKLYLLSKGRVINLVGAEGHPPEVMALSFANQLLSVLFLAKNYRLLENKVYNVPPDIDINVAHYAVEAAGLKIDEC